MLKRRWPKILDHYTAHHDAVELALYKFIGEKYHAHSSTGRLDVCPLIDTPRDFFGFSYLARFEKSDELTFIAHYYDFYKEFDESVIANNLMLRKRNTEGWALSDKNHKLLLFVISDDIKNLRSYKAVIKKAWPLDNVEMFRLLYRYDSTASVNGSKFYDLTELDDDDNEIHFY